MAKVRRKLSYYKGVRVYNKPRGGKLDEKWDVFQRGSALSQHRWLKDGGFRPYLVRGRFGGLNVYYHDKRPGT